MQTVLIFLIIFASLISVIYVNDKLTTDYLYLKAYYELIGKTDSE